MPDIWTDVFARCWIEPRDVAIAAEQCGEAWPGSDCADYAQWADALAELLRTRANYTGTVYPGHIRQAYWRAVALCTAALALADHGLTLDALLAEQAEAKRRAA